MEGTKYKSTYNFMTTIAPITMTKQILVQGEGKGDEEQVRKRNLIKYVNHSFKKNLLLLFCFLF